jgi:peroxiredoxin
MVSTQFDSYLRLEDAKGRELAEDDDSGGNLNAQIVFTCPKDGNYKVIATAYGAQGFGDYTLTVKRRGTAQPVATSHTLLVGKAAPDFAADFAVNGKPGRLSDLKGKVVLLQFWDVRSEPCAATFPRLAAWQKAHKDDGLEIVGVTFYHVDLGQNIGFDAKTGRLTRLDEATRATEQAMLRDFAAHHKLGHVLLPLAKDEALRAFDAYAVSSMPQFVVIDRKGMVRAVHVGEGEGTASAVEAEIKKALEGK